MSVSLAEPRRKQKWNLNPRGKIWTDDASKFGQRMLEKMGWSPGKGLGIEEQGVKEPIKQNYKNDNKGVGFEGNYDNNWLSHHDDFTSLLSELNKNVTGGDEQTQTTQKKTSLQERAKTAKARVYFHKLIKGKDLSSCSENDLASILGSCRSKTKQPEYKPEMPTPKFYDESSGSEQAEDKSFGVQTIKSGSMEEYFKQIMKKKEDRGNEGAPNVTINIYGNADFSGMCKEGNQETDEKVESMEVSENVDSAVNENKKIKKKSLPEFVVTEDTASQQSDINQEVSESSKKRKKKSKKTKQNVENSSEQISHQDAINEFTIIEEDVKEEINKQNEVTEEASETSNKRKKKSKKMKQDVDNSNEQIPAVNEFTIIEENSHDVPVANAKKNKKTKSPLEVVDNEIQTQEVPVKKSKKRKLEETTSNGPVAVTAIQENGESKKKRKKKNNKIHPAPEDCPAVKSLLDVVENIESEKKSKQNGECIKKNESIVEQQTQSPKKKKKKKNKKKSSEENSSSHEKSEPVVPKKLESEANVNSSEQNNSETSKPTVDNNVKSNASGFVDISRKNFNARNNRGGFQNNFNNRGGFQNNFRGGGRGASNFRGGSRGASNNFRGGNNSKRGSWGNKAPLKPKPPKPMKVPFDHKEVCDAFLGANLAAIAGYKLE